MNPKIQQMADVLKSRYNCIDKRRAAKFLKDCFPDMKKYEFIEAYRLAYK